MAVITSPTPGSHFSNGITAQSQTTLANANFPIGENARWQWNLTGAESTANAGSNLRLQCIADDGFTIIATPISIVRSTGVVTIDTGSSIEFGDGTVTAPSILNTTNNASGFYFTTNAVNVTANGVRAMQWATATTGVNYMVVTPAAANGIVTLTAAGADTDIGLLISGKGADPVSIGGSTQANTSLQVSTTASAVNWVSVAGSATSGSVVISSGGTDTDIPLTITTKGAGDIVVGDTTSNTLLGGGVAGALATTAVAGYPALPTCAGTPTGVPVGHAAGRAYMIFDTTGTKLWAYKEGTGWVGVVLS